ncbi:type II toxin-antitoxin system VapC family toxin [Nocardioides sp. BGMRC 2183]|nr:type II toxin-antitoxin system VapC family toxin [Nocardioides sp. BGMRC 2183]
MRLVDTNVLLYAVDRRSEHHRASRRWLERSLSGDATVCFSWLALLGFVRIVTNDRIAATPLTTTEALDVVDAWLGARSARIVHPGSRHPALLRDLLKSRTGNLVNDAHLAALALEHKAVVVTFDSDFGRFPGVRWERPS